MEHYKSIGGEMVSPWRKEMRELYADYQNSKAWKDNRSTCLKSNGGKCFNSSCNNDAVVAHHIKYDNWALGDEELKDLIPLCKGCHSKIHRGKDFVPFFARQGCSPFWFTDEDYKNEYMKLFDIK